jgi:type I restriction enzyme M protein
MLRNETRDENRAERTGKPFQRRFKGDEQHLRWQNVRHTPSESIIPLVRDAVFPHFKSTVTIGDPACGTGGLQRHQ